MYTNTILRMLAFALLKNGKKALAKLHSVVWVHVSYMQYTDGSEHYARRPKLNIFILLLSEGKIASIYNSLPHILRWSVSVTRFLHGKNRHVHVHNLCTLKIDIYAQIKDFSFLLYRKTPPLPHTKGMKLNQMSRLAATPSGCNPPDEINRRQFGTCRWWSR